jgi:hypothetical protein
MASDGNVGTYPARGIVDVRVWKIRVKNGLERDLKQVRNQDVTVGGESHAKKWTVRILLRQSGKAFVAERGIQLACGSVADHPTRNVASDVGDQEFTIRLQDERSARTHYILDGCGRAGGAERLIKRAIA